VAHFDCFSGISGDMVLGALVDAGVDANAIRVGLESLGLPIGFSVEKEKRGGFAATRAHVEAPVEDTHRFLPDVEEILNRGSLTQRQRDLALRIFRRLAEAESTAHGMPLERVHFHEVGALDSIADIAGAAIGLDLLGAERITSRPVPTGIGSVKCAHGVMPIPTPGTAALLKGFPIAASNIKMELTTPTGAAILTTIVHEFCELPAMTIESIGCGAGKRDLLEQPNILRLFVGTSPDTSTERDTVWVLETNLDDVSGEVIGFTIERLFAAGALDVFTIPIQMKKHRPGVILSVIASESQVPLLETILFRETATFGVRKWRTERSKLQREPHVVQTKWGTITGKRGWRDGLNVFTPEYEDCAKVAREQGVPLREVFEVVRRAFE